MATAIGIPPPPVRRQVFALPSSTPADTGYPNIPMAARKFSSKRPFRRVQSAEENDLGLLFNLKKFWGYDAFRGPQLDICRSVIRDRDVMVVAPTGIGKSLCFQVPAVTIEYGVTLVVSPLKALMHDQVNTLKEKGVRAMMACNDTSMAEMAEINRQLRLGHPEIRLLYITPESLFTSQRYRDGIRACYDNGQMRRLVIDEAHCIDEWGRSFRPSYRLLGDFRRLYPRVAITALTASATKDTRLDILASLRISNDNLDTWVEPCNRKNLFYEVIYRGPDDEESLSIDDQIVKWIKEHRPGFAERNATHGVSEGCVTGIIYCRLRRQCEAIAKHLQDKGMRAKAYHAEMPQKIKEGVQADWIAGRIEVVCATIAFGMGIDQAHVRYVIHYNIPTTMEGFYQETGRAGRDRHMSRCLLIYSREDARAHRRKLGQEVSGQKGEEKAQEREKEHSKRRILDSFAWLQANYIENTTVCRHISICRYFGEHINAEDEVLRRAYCDGMCDVCTDPVGVARRAATLNGDIDIASQVVRPEVEFGIEPSSTDHASSDAARPVGTMALLNTTGHTRSSGLFPSSSPPVSPRAKRRKAFIAGASTAHVAPFKELVSTNLQASAGTAGPADQVPDAGPTRQAVTTPSTAETASIPDEATAAPIVPPSITSQGKRRIGLVAYSSTVPSNNSSSIERRLPLLDVTSTDSNNKGKGKARDLAAGQKPVMARASRSSTGAAADAPEIAPRMPKVKPKPIRKAVRGPFPTAPPTRPGPGPTRVFTVDSILPGPGEGSYALPAPPPEDEDRRKRQREAFEGVEAVDGDGPYAYYNTPGAAGAAGPSRDVRRVQAGFKTPFRSPLLQVAPKSRVGPILGDSRKEALKLLQEALLKNLGRSAPGHTVWVYWDGTTGSAEETKGIKRVAREIEADIVRRSPTNTDFRRSVDQACKALRLLRIPSVVKAICEGELAGDFGDGEVGEWMRLVEKFARQEADRRTG